MSTSRSAAREVSPTKNESSVSPTPASEGWTDESFEANWPMEIPPLVDAHPNDPLEFPVRVPKSMILNSNVKE